MLCGTFATVPLPEIRLAPGAADTNPLPRRMPSQTNSSLFRFYGSAPFELWCDIQHTSYSCHVLLQQVAQSSTWRTQPAVRRLLRMHLVVCCVLIKQVSDYLRPACQFTAGMDPSMSRCREKH
jgi:hypothetical protein